jgi:hypothetical protein
MTAKQAYENVLLELRKVKSPSLHLEDYNYFINKGIQEYVNLRYNLFATTQQLSDDLQSLTKHAILTITPLTPFSYTGSYGGGFTQAVVPVSTGKKYGSDYYRFNAPGDYFHFLGSHVTTVTKFPQKCYPAGYENNLPSKRLEPNIANGIVNNAYLRPDFNRPYHSFENAIGSLKPDLFYYIGDIRKYDIKDIYIDYLKEPEIVNLTLQQRDLPLDTSAPLEFPEYVCNEIIKNVVKLVLESSSDPRLKTHIPINKSIE